ncbi:MAG: methyl-accepting chemotaxis protein [Gammaproteobacteria bacterium]|nr:methyl-accepting chemotaxis protein [Gammaproteobacteria bacterium]MBU1624556.1 methyl-accepting chemotaxis protein [Gammaproteobacteria bacterium]MBU1982400.1 methyl-accepting chemotaxis protein [Gammaproteobacteria bacterium]
MAFKLPFGKTSPKLTKHGAGSQKASSAIRIPWFSDQSFDRQLRILGFLLLVFLIVAAVFTYLDTRTSSAGSRYVAQASKLQLLALQLAKHAEVASISGENDAFDALLSTRAAFTDTLNSLDKGNAELPATTGAPRDSLDLLLQKWQRQEILLNQVEEGRPLLVTLERGASLQRDMLHRADVIALRAPLVYAQKAARLQLLLEQIVGAVQTVQTSSSIDILATLPDKMQAARALFSELPQTDSDVLELAEEFEGYQNVVGFIISNQKTLLSSRQAAQQLLNEDARMQSLMQNLLNAYEQSGSNRLTSFVVAFSGGMLLLLLLLLSKIYLDESQRREHDSARINRQNQQAILRLMNELSDLADGDLSAKATVSEDITGAIADSINYTTDELRKLVARVITASEQVNKATSDAGTVAKGLLNAAGKQAEEIREAGSAVELMTKSIQEVDSSAAQASQVASRTLQVTEQGAKAVQTSVTGMDSIREQIQETSKRIKRLGESSQEIGEIVDLISDITEQTNVLALNAAIQAASAGEAGRGFAVVAEEVQRLAERSGEATKQIGLLVKTIQGDTNDAVAAMEKSTQGVVEGAQLADDAGHSLQEIEKATRELTDLVNSISVSTQVQTDMAQEVASAMADILKITEQTTKGTQLTSASVNQLEGLAKELSGSVSGFKL